ncbi:MAG TPA: DUF58 domain-containing protein [Thermoanaerobaculia bacterium]|nr:DUF58 domain-containing protein [Thermoanaerobaculia bacterium]
MSRRRKRRRRVVPEGIRITKVGLWFVLLTVVVAVAATNTGNNALYMVLALMLATLIVSGVTSRTNVRSLEASVEAPGEVYAQRPFRVRFSLANRGWLLPRWLLLVSLERGGPPRLVPYLERGGTSRGELEALLPRRGVHRFANVHLTSLFPFGFFRKGARHAVDLEVMVFPELFEAASRRVEGDGRLGQGRARRAHWGHDLHSLRSFRQGDDPRAIHWKQTARTGDLVYMERAAERGRRLSILFDNGVGKLDDPSDAARFEHLVSEAATAAVDHLARGWEVELVSREGTLPFATGPRQRLAVLEALAVVEPAERAVVPLLPSDSLAPTLRLSLEREAAA